MLHLYQAGNAKSLNSTVSLTSVIAQSSQEVSISEVHLFNYWYQMETCL